MKKYVTLAATLLLFTLASCQQDENDVENFRGLSRAVDDEAVSTFFNATSDNGESVLKDLFPRLVTDTCFLVTSVKELESLYAGDKELPEIDFDECSLLIGMKKIAAGYVVENRTVEVTDESIIVTLTLKNEVPDGAGVIGAMLPYYFWGLYEKLPNKNVIIR